MVSRALARGLGAAPGDGGTRAPPSPQRIEKRDQEAVDLVGLLLLHPVSGALDQVDAAQIVLGDSRRRPLSVPTQMFASISSKMLQADSSASPWSTTILASGPRGSGWMGHNRLPNVPAHNLPARSPVARNGGASAGR